MARSKPHYALLAEALYELYAAAAGEKEEHAVASAFAAYCVRHHHAHLLPKIEAELHRIEKRQKGIVDAHVVSAVALGADEKKEVIRSIAAFLKKDSAHIAARFSEDAAVGGGLHITAGDYVIDGTIAATLRKLHKQLTA